MSNNIPEPKKTEIWKIFDRKYPGLTVEIHHWTVLAHKHASLDWNDGGHRWNVYALINKECQPLLFTADDDLFPLHCGQSYDQIEVIYYTDNQDSPYYTIRKIGSDYQHCDDEKFNRCFNIPYEVLQDAEKLWQFLVVNAKESVQ